LPSDYYYLSVRQTLLYSKGSAVVDELTGISANKIDEQCIFRHPSSAATAVAAAANGISPDSSTV